MWLPGRFIWGQKGAWTSFRSITAQFLAHPLKQRKVLWGFDRILGKKISCPSVDKAMSQRGALRSKAYSWWGIWSTKPLFFYLQFRSSLEALSWRPWLGQSGNLAAACLLGGKSLIRWAGNMTARASPRMFWLVIQDEHLEAKRSLE